jgi:hypothetical protein
MIQVKKYNSIHHIDPQHWNSILETDDTFHTWQFIRIVEDSKVENSRFQYLLFYNEQQLVASTVLSAFSISLDIFISNAGWVQRVKKWRPGFFNIRILICGLPASFGQLNLKIADEFFADEVCSRIAKEMKLLAKEWKIRFLSVKEFLERNKEVGRQFLKEQFFLANSIPYMSMKVRWQTFAEYIRSLRHSYRRHILQSMHKINCEEPIIVHSDHYDRNSGEIVWVLSEPAWLSPRLYHELYLQVMERTKTKLETLNHDFFKELFKDNRHYQLLSLVQQGNILSTALLVPHGDTLTFMLVGRVNEKDEFDSYFNLVYGIIAYAIGRKFKKIKLGQTAYWVKQSVGGEPENQYIYFASTGKFRHWVLKMLNRLVFPQVTLQSIKVFKEHTNDSSAFPG